MPGRDSSPLVEGSRFRFDVNHADVNHAGPRQLASSNVPKGEPVDLITLNPKPKTLNPPER